MPRLVDGLEQIFTNLGIVGAGYKLFFFETTTTTPKTTYSNEGLTIQNPNPVVCDETGRPEFDIWGLDPSTYKMVLGTPDSVIGNINPIKEVDPVNNLNSGSIIIIDPLPAAYWGLTTGTSTAYVLDPALVPITFYSNKQCFFIDFHTACGANPTLDVNDLGALNLKKYSGVGTKISLIAGDVQAQRYIAINDGVDIVILDPETVYTLKANTIDSAAFSNKKVTISNNVVDANNDIDFSAGTSFDTTNNVGYVNPSALTKRLDAVWAAGNNQGGLDTGVEAVNTFYYCYTIYNPSANTADAIFSLADSSVGPLLPSGYTNFSYVGAIRNDGSSNIKSFRQSNNYFYRNLVLDRTNGSAPDTAAHLLAVEVPPGRIVILNSRVNSASDNFFNLQSAFETDSTPTLNNCVAAAINGPTIYAEVLTNSSSQIRYRADSTNIEFNIMSRGWIDNNL